MIAKKLDIPVPDFTSFDNELDGLDAEQKTSENLSFSHMEADQLSRLIANQTDNQLILIDCRYDYEYNGGHIYGAISINNENLFQNIFAHLDPNKSYDNMIFVFYCEFSQNRGPEMASMFRRIDRSINYSRYPFIYFKNVFILKGGYKFFYSKYSNLCIGNYSPMSDNKHLIALSKKKREAMIKSYFPENGKIEPEMNNSISFSLSQPIFLNLI